MRRGGETGTARCLMRTTLQLDDDVLVAARLIARAGKKSLGSVISDLTRKALRATDSRQVDARSVDGGQRSGLPLLPTKAPGVIIDLELVNQLRDEEH